MPKIKDIDFIHVGSENSRNEIIYHPRKVRNHINGCNKPDGVLWTAPLINDLSAWERFQLDNDDYYRYGGVSHERWHIVPKDNCRILIIDKPCHFQKLEKYRFKDSDQLNDKKIVNQIDYEAMAKDYDAFYITDQALCYAVEENDDKNHHINWLNFESWDCASCIFFHSDKFMVMTDEEYKLYKEKGIKPEYMSEKILPKSKICQSIETPIYKKPNFDWQTIKINERFFASVPRNVMNKEEVCELLWNEGVNFCEQWLSSLIKDLEKCQPKIAKYEDPDVKEDIEKKLYDEVPLSDKELLMSKYYTRREIIEHLTYCLESFKHELNKNSSPDDDQAKDEFKLSISEFFEYANPYESDMFKVCMNYGFDVQNAFCHVYDLDGIKKLLDFGAKLNIPDSDGLYPINYIKTKDMLEFYINSGVNIRDFNSVVNSDNHNFEIYEYFLNIGLNPNYNEEILFSPKLVSSDIKLLFLQYGADPNIINDEGDTPLFKHLRETTSSYNDIYKCTEALLRYGANPNATDKDGKTPLMYAKTPEYIELLLAYGANPEAKDNNGKSVLDYISENRAGKEEGINLIKKAIIQKNKETTRKVNNIFKTVMNKLLRHSQKKSFKTAKKSHHQNSYFGERDLRN